MPGDSDDAPHIKFDATSLPQHERDSGSGGGGGTARSDADSPDHEHHTSAGGRGGGGGENNKEQSSSPPVVSSTTTTATTPPSSPRTAGSLSSPERRGGHGPESSSGARGRTASPRANLHAAAAAHAASAATDEPDTDTDESNPSRRQDATTAAVPASSGAAAAAADQQPLPAGVVQQYPSANPGLAQQSPITSIKILVSNNVAGSIIGRSGQTISDLQVQSNSRIKLSQSGDFYPGTSDRVCLIQGGKQQVRVASSMILQRIHELQRQAQQRGQQQLQQDQLAEQQQQQQQNQSPFPEVQRPAGDAAIATGQPLGFVIRVLVPTPACGMIIGRGGSNIKTMAETSGVTSIRLSPKEQEGAAGPGAGIVGMGAGAIVAATGERIVTISGPDLSSTITCVGLIIDGMATHPEIGRYSNMTTSYTRASSSISAAAAATLQQGAPAPLFAPMHPATSGASTAGGPYGLAVPTPVPLSTLAGSSPSSLMLSPPSPLLQGQHPPPSQQGTGDASTQGGDKDALESSQHQPQQIRYAPFASAGTDASSSSLYQSPHAQAPTSHPIYPGTPAAPIPTLQGSYGPLSPQQAVTDQPLFVQVGQPSMQQQQQQQRASMYSPVGGRSRSNLSRGSSQEDLTYAPPPSSTMTAATDQFASMQVGGTSSLSDDGRFVSDMTQQRLPQGSTIQMAVPDALIGSILGRGGQTLNELQVSTSTGIKISQRGVYVPGTTNRVVTITGPTGASVATAQYLVNQRVARSSAARQQQQQQQQQQESRSRHGSGASTPTRYYQQPQPPTQGQPHQQGQQQPQQQSHQRRQSRSEGEPNP